MWLSSLLIGLTRLFLGATPRWLGCSPSPTQRIYFANHTSHLDSLAVWAALPAETRTHTRTVAAADYWDQDPLRRFVARKGLHALFIRRGGGGNSSPLAPLEESLTAGESLILFPEGTRRAQALPSEFKAGLFHLARQFPEVELIPVYLENLHRSMPKGSLFPLPLICTVRFGAPVTLSPGEDKTSFLERARNAVASLA